MVNICITAMCLTLTTVFRLTSAKYIIPVISALVICIIFNLLPILLLVLYPFGRFRRMLSKLRLDRISLTIFIEKFHCCYRDGLDGKRDMRYFSGVYFFLEIPLFFFPSLMSHIFNFDLMVHKRNHLFNRSTAHYSV